MDITKAKIWFEEGRFEEIIRYNENHFPQSTNLPADLRLLQAYSLQKTGKFEEAMQHWNVLSALNPEDAYVYLERGVCKFNLRFKHAMEDFDKAISLQPDNAYFHAAKAFVLDKVGRISEAVYHYELSIKLDPENEITLNNLAVTEQKRGNQSKAEEWMRMTDDLLRSKGLLPEPEPAVEDQPKEFIPADIIEPTPSVESTSKWVEIKKMVSSKEEFVKFLQDALNLLRKKKSE